MRKVNTTKYSKSLNFRSLLRGGGLLFILFVAIMYQSSCATRASPDGGPRDTIAPILDTAFPANGTLFFDKKRIELHFNEYLTLKDASSQIRISPLQNEKPDISLVKKTIYIELKDTLKPKTTYIISFGKSLTDFTEGNVNEGFKYVFSTGSYIDSLRLTGSILDAKTGEGVPDLFVALYDSALYQQDSVAYKKLPDYYAYTTENGSFEITNIKKGAYGLIAFNDQRGDFKLNSGLEQVAFLDSMIQINKDVSGIKLNLFKPLGVQRFSGARQQSNNMVMFAFNRPVQDFSIDVINNKVDSVGAFFFDANRDTVSYYFANELDSLVFIWREATLGGDTTVIKLRNLRESALDLKLKDKELRKGDTLILNSKAPLKLTQNKYYILDGKDTLSNTYNVEGLAYRFTFNYTPKNKNYKLALPEGFFTTLEGVKSDSLTFDISFLKPEDLGTLDFAVKVQGDTSTTFILQLIEEVNNNVLVEKSFVGKTLVQLIDVKPRKLKARLIKDIDGSGDWTTGSLIDKRQPEPILIYKEAVEMRANWEMEMEWQVKP